MSNTKTIGGPAFPVTLSEHQTMASHHANGMTLRDYFAAKAMQGHWSNANGDSTLDWMEANPDLEEGELRIVAKLAYAQADAMLKAREQ